VRVENVDLRLGQKLTVPLTLERATLVESIQVVAESPTIAVTQSVRATSLHREELDQLPNGREFKDVINQVAGANQEDTRAWSEFSIDGSSASENRFIIDGVEFTGMVYGISRLFGSRLLVTDFLDEVQVKYSGYMAEYGGATGGEVNGLTRSGTNDWHGEGLLYWKTDGLDASSRPTLQLNPQQNDVAEYVTYPEDQYRSLEPGFTLGGPIIRDTLWIFGGYIPYFRLLDRTAPFADGTTATLSQPLNSHQAVVNLSGQLGPDWRFRTAFNTTRSRQEGLLQDKDGTSDPEAYYGEVLVQPTWSLSGSLDWMPRQDLFMSLRVGYYFRDWYKENVLETDMLVWQTSSVGLPGVPTEYQQVRGYSNVPTNIGWDRDRRGRLGIQWDSTFFFDGAGQHQLKAGVQLDRRTLDRLGGTTGNVHRLYWDQSFIGQRGEYGHYMVESNSVLPNRGWIEVGDVQSTNVGLFVQDSWTLGGRLTLNLGLRTENEDVPSFSQDPDVPDTAIHWGFGDKLAPRLGFAWDLTGDGRTKLYGSWGVFYDIMKLRLPLAYEGTYQSYLWYTLDDPDVSRIENNPACPPECPGVPFYEWGWVSPTALNDPQDPVVDPTLQPMQQLEEAVLGLEREIAPDLTIGVRYIHKQLDRAVEDIGVRDEEGVLSYRIGNPGFGIAESFVPEGGTTSMPYPEARRDYDAVELVLDRRMSSRWGGRFSYLWSRLYGNTGGLAESDFSALNPNVAPTWDSVLMPFDEQGQPVYGRLATDRPHQIKAQLLYDFPFGTVVGASWHGASGVPRMRGVPFNQIYQQVLYAGRETDGRMPFASRLDLQVQQRIGLSDRLQLTLMATVFNLFDQGRATDYFASELLWGGMVQISEATFFEGVDTQQLIEEQGLVRDARLLMDREFQPPRTIRLGLPSGSGLPTGASVLLAREGAGDAPQARLSPRAEPLLAGADPVPGSSRLRSSARGVVLGPGSAPGPGPQTPPRRLSRLPLAPPCHVRPCACRSRSPAARRCSRRRPPPATASPS
jgi:hypothetical protein